MRNLFEPTAAFALAADTSLGGGEDRTSNTLRAYLEIRRRILENEMPPNTQYLEQELAEMLNMSRTPVREALIRLAEERLVEVRPRHGARVLPVLAEDMREIYDILTELEAMAARQMAERGLPEGVINEMEGAVAAMQQALRASNMKLWSENDRLFHALLIEATGNRRLKEVVRTLVDQSHRARMQTLAHRPPPEDSNRDHANLLIAIRKRDREAAHRIHFDHRARAGKMLTEILTRVQARG